VIPLATLVVFFIIFSVSALKGVQVNKQVYSSELVSLVESKLVIDLDFILRKITLIRAQYSDAVVNEDTKKLILKDLVEYISSRQTTDKVILWEKQSSHSGNTIYRALYNADYKPHIISEIIKTMLLKKDAQFSEVIKFSDPVSNRKQEALLVVREFSPLDLVIAKSYPLEPLQITGDSEFISLTFNRASSVNLKVMFIASIMIFLMTLYLITRNQKLLNSITLLKQRRLERLKKYNTHLQNLIKSNLESIAKIKEKNEKAEQKQELKTAEYKNMNLMLIAENMERLQQERVLRIEKEKAEEANIAKREFLTNFSDKLKDMIKEIKDLALKASNSFDESDQDGILETFGRINSQGNKLMHMLELIIELSRLESGKTTDKTALMDLRELLTKANYETIPLFAETDSSLNIIFSEEAIIIRTKYRHLELVLLHLLSAIARNLNQGSSVELSCYNNELTDTAVSQGSATLQLTTSGLNERFRLINTKSEDLDNSDISLINLKIFREALTHVHGSFSLNLTDGIYIIRVEIPKMEKLHD
jgi:signal transduction histidine kinase